METLTQVIDFLDGRWNGEIPKAVEQVETAVTANDDDLADVKGQEQAKRALEVAAAGGHNLLNLWYDSRSIAKRNSSSLKLLAISRKLPY